MTATAWALRRRLVLRGVELTGSWDDAEDLVQEAYVAMVARPPVDPSPSQLHHWLRTVMQRRRDDRLRRFYRGSADLLDFCDVELEAVSVS